METLLRALPKFSVDDGQPVCAITHTILKNFIETSNREPRQPATFSGDPIKSPKISPIDNTWHLSATRG